MWRRKRKMRRKAYDDKDSEDKEHEQGKEEVVIRQIRA